MEAQNTTEHPKFQLAMAHQVQHTMNHIANTLDKAQQDAHEMMQYILSAFDILSDMGDFVDEHGIDSSVSICLFHIKKLEQQAKYHNIDLEGVFATQKKSLFKTWATAKYWFEDNLYTQVMNNLDVLYMGSPDLLTLAPSQDIVNVILTHYDLLLTMEEIMSKRGKNPGQEFRNYKSKLIRMLTQMNKGIVEKTPRFVNMQKTFELIDITSLDWAVFKRAVLISNIYEFLAFVYEQSAQNNLSAQDYEKMFQQFESRATKNDIDINLIYEDMKIDFESQPATYVEFKKFWCKK